MFNFLFVLLFLVLASSSSSPFSLLVAGQTTDRYCISATTSSGTYYLSQYSQLDPTVSLFKTCDCIKSTWNVTGQVSGIPSGEERTLCITNAASNRTFWTEKGFSNYVSKLSTKGLGCDTNDQNKWNVTSTGCLENLKWSRWFYVLNSDIRTSTSVCSSTSTSYGQKWTFDKVSSKACVPQVKREKGVYCIRTKGKDGQYYYVNYVSPAYTTIRMMKSCDCDRGSWILDPTENSFSGTCITSNTTNTSLYATKSGSAKSQLGFGIGNQHCSSGESKYQFSVISSEGAKMCITNPNVELSYWNMDRTATDRIIALSGAGNGCQWSSTVNMSWDFVPASSVCKKPPPPRKWGSYCIRTWTQKGWKYLSSFSSNYPDTRLLDFCDCSRSVFWLNPTPRSGNLTCVIHNESGRLLQGTQPLSKVFWELGDKRSVNGQCPSGSAFSDSYKFDITSYTGCFYNYGFAKSSLYTKLDGTASSSSTATANGNCPDSPSSSTTYNYTWEFVESASTCEMPPAPKTKQGEYVIRSKGKKNYYYLNALSPRFPDLQFSKSAVCSGGVFNMNPTAYANRPTCIQENTTGRFLHTYPNSRGTTRYAELKPAPDGRQNCSSLAGLEDAFKWTIKDVGCLSNVDVDDSYFYINRNIGQIYAAGSKCYVYTSSTATYNYTFDYLPAATACTPTPAPKQFGHYCIRTKTPDGWKYLSSHNSTASDPVLLPNCGCKNSVWSLNPTPSAYNLTCIIHTDTSRRLYTDVVGTKGYLRLSSSANATCPNLVGNASYQNNNNDDKFLYDITYDGCIHNYDHKSSYVAVKRLTNVLYGSFSSCSPTSTTYNYSWEFVEVNLSACVDPTTTSTTTTVLTTTSTPTTTTTGTSSSTTTAAPTTTTTKMATTSSTQTQTPSTTTTAAATTTTSTPSTTAATSSTTSAPPTTTTAAATTAIIASTTTAMSSSASPSTTTASTGTTSSTSAPTTTTVAGGGTSTTLPSTTTQATGTTASTTKAATTTGAAGTETTANTNTGTNSAASTTTVASEGTTSTSTSNNVLLSTTTAAAASGTNTQSAASSTSSASSSVLPTTSSADSPSSSSAVNASTTTAVETTTSSATAGSLSSAAAGTTTQMTTATTTTTTQAAPTSVVGILTNPTSFDSAAFASGLASKLGISSSAIVVTKINSTAITISFASSVDTTTAEQNVNTIVAMSSSTLDSLGLSRAAPSSSSADLPPTTAAPAGDGGSNPTVIIVVVVVSVLVVLALAAFLYNRNKKNSTGTGMNGNDNNDGGTKQFSNFHVSEGDVMLQEEPVSSYQPVAFQQPPLLDTSML